MAVDRTVSVTARDRGGMTLGELRRFVGEMDQAGAADSTVIGAGVTFGGKLKKLTATAVRFGDRENVHD